MPFFTLKKGHGTHLLCVIPVQFMHHGGFSVSSHHHLLLLQLLCHLRHITQIALLMSQQFKVTSLTII